MFDKITQAFNPEKIDLKEHEVIITTMCGRNVYRNIKNDDIIVSPTDEQFIIQSVTIIFVFIIIAIGIFFIDKYTFIKIDYMISCISILIFSISSIYIILVILFYLYDVINYFAKYKHN